MKSVRVVIAALLAVGVTFGLFLFMYKLISLGSGDRTELDAIAGIHFGPVEIPDDIVERSRRKPQKPPPPKDPPPPPRMQVSRMDKTVQQMPQMDMPQIDVPMTGGGGMFIGNFEQIDKSAEGDIIPIVRINPIYPREAAMKGTEGWVKIEFTITEVGTVKNPRVIDASPPRIFNREATRAILKWKFKPRVIDGVAVERRATQTIDFTLEGS
ncbi:MAG: energy transducer TonB [Xanthomonadales bacterium]|jgi:protein TonB|nr:energy transducer TonB [Xanthomonadales bacterium]